MSTSIHTRIHIDKPRNLVFDFLRDMNNIPKWNYNVQDVQRIPGFPEMEIYRQVRRNDKQLFKVAGIQAGKQIEIETLPGSKVQFFRRMKLYKTDRSSCILEDEFLVDTGHSPLLQSLFKSNIRSAVKDNLNKLKSLLEEGSVRLQDGSHSRIKTS